MLPSFAQAFASDNMSTTLPPIRKRAVKPSTDDHSNKKRRLTHSPHPRPHPLRTDLDDTKHQSNSTPISPIGFTVQRDLIDHVRSVKQIRKKQEALIEQRRESDSTQQPTSSSSPRIQVPTSPSGPSSSRLPPPPISFANRAINAGKKKPADLLLVNPRDPPSPYPAFHSATTRHLALHPNSLLQPSVQSAPPSQNAFSIPMALPRLPSNLISGPPPAISGSRRVPPTPTRLSMQATSSSNPPTIPNGKSPPANIPIAATLVPQTPTSLAINRAINFANSSQPQIVLTAPAPASTSTSSNSSATTVAPANAAKQAFLAPFELFYDALHDARQLKEWLSEQLTRTAALTKRWEEEVARLEANSNSIARDQGVPQIKREETETSLNIGVDGVDLKEELERLRRRVDELEGRMGSVTATPANGTTTTTASSSSSTSSHSSHEGYIFPQQQQQQQLRQQQQQQYEHQWEHHQQLQREREQRQDQPTGPVALPLLPAISGRLSLGVRPELGRRLSSPGWHSIGSIRGSGTGYRVVGKADDGQGGRTGVGMVGLGVSKSLSGPGTSGGGAAFAAGISNSRRRVSISGGVVPGVCEKETLDEGESVPRGRERTVKRGRGGEDRPAVEETHAGVQEEAEGGMNVDGVEEGGKGEQERDGEGEQERVEEKESRR